jgi:BirA family transcriptional regulator, biotin operon repressor / biotin---[acetyl-CoA-carboxylase] ligase
VSGAAPERATPTHTRVGHPRLHLRRTGSTNERVRELAFAGAPHGTLVTAAEQTAGRGRQGRRWSAPAGSSLLMSLLLRDPPALLPLIAAVAVCDVAGAHTQIKWPNDVVVASPPASSREGEGEAKGEGETHGAGGLAKLAGILVEGRPYPQGHTPSSAPHGAQAGTQGGWAVLGIGLNVAVRLDQLPDELRSPAHTGLPAATLGLERADVEPLLARLLDALERRLREPAQDTLQAWRARDALRGREVAWAQGRGRAEGIDGAGRLIVALAGGGRTELAAGEVHLLEIG